MMCQRRRIQVEQERVAELGISLRPYYSLGANAHKIESRAWVSSPPTLSAAPCSMTSQTYTLSRPFAKPPHTSPAQTLRKTCQQAFSIDIPPAHLPKLVTILPVVVPRNHCEFSSVGQKLATWRMRTENSSHARKRAIIPGIRRYFGVSGETRISATAYVSYRYTSFYD